MAVKGSTNRLRDQRVGEAEADGDVPPFDIRLAVNERLVRLSGAREKRGPSLYALAVREGVALEVELVSALLRPPPCIQVAILLA